MHLKMSVESLLEPGHNTVIPLKRNLRMRRQRALARSACPLGGATVGATLRGV
jgi:hypothetical protein